MPFWGFKGFWEESHTEEAKTQSNSNFCVSASQSSESKTAKTSSRQAGLGVASGPLQVAHAEKLPDKQRLLRDVLENPEFPTRATPDEIAMGTFLTVQKIQKTQDMHSGKLHDLDMRVAKLEGKQEAQDNFNKMMAEAFVSQSQCKGGGVASINHSKEFEKFQQFASIQAAEPVKSYYQEFGHPILSTTFYVILPLIGFFVSNRKVFKKEQISKSSKNLLLSEKSKNYEFNEKIECIPLTKNIEYFYYPPESIKKKLNNKQ